ncbi:hypothetical protein IWX87_003539 [Polaromonas sp. CG_9.7]|nr:hypothetical protein [Polaromonas sp. CG_9.7]MBG6115798.1 hypothetical protein [Polaromonas sp. CG_9.2]MDH6186700.1 hypothetical protein [Polaromonas sp. CG_23.6]
MVTPSLVHRTIQVLQLAIDQDAGLIHAPTGANCPLVLSEYLLQQWQKLDRPAADAGVINMHATFVHHFFQVAVTQ